MTTTLGPELPTLSLPHGLNTLLGAAVLPPLSAAVVLSRLSAAVVLSRLSAAAVLSRLSAASLLRSPTGFLSSKLERSIRPWVARSMRSRPIPLLTNRPCSSLRNSFLTMLLP